MHYPLKQPTSLVDHVVPLIVQARCASSRYAQKVLRIFADDHSLLEFQLIRLKKAFPFSPIVVATTTAPSDQAIEDIASANNVLCYRGDEQDVLERFLHCCAHFQFKGYIMRICADNPFLQMDLLRTLMDESSKEDCQNDYISYSIGNNPAILTHFGFFAEMIKVDALYQVAQEASAPCYREHVTNYIYQGAGKEHFKISWLALDELAGHLDSVRLTIDSQEDFENARFVYERMKTTEGDTAFSWRNILSFIDDHPTVRSSMRKQIELNRK